MTTDRFPKSGSINLNIGSSKVTIGGIAKGAGMIHPNMATMLCFVTTDASVDRSFLQEALWNSVNASLNMISVDGDTSTNDSVIVMANGIAENNTLHNGSENAEIFQQALNDVCIYLAKCIARDGEGSCRNQ